MRAIFGDLWIFVSALLVYVGLISNSTVVLALAMLVFGAGGISRLWARVSLEEVEYRRELSETRAFVGETIELDVHLSNGKFIPVPWIEVRELIPQEMLVIGGRTRASGLPRTNAFYRNTSLKQYEQVKWPLRLRTTVRGYFRIGPTRLRSGDLFGFFESERDFEQQDAIIVYPKTYALPDLGLGSARPFGDQRGGHRIYEDPLRVIGVRDYVPGDPLKRVDWKATARVGRLQSRLYEPSRTQSVVVALNITTMEHTWEGFDPVLLERGVSVSASIARSIFEQGAAVGLIANGSFPDADRPLRLGANRRPDQLVRMLETLAMITSYTTSRLSDELESREHGLPAGATVVVVAALMPQDLFATLHRLRNEGHAVHVVKTSDEPWEEPFNQIPVSDVSPFMREIEEANAAEAEAATGERDASVARRGVLA